MGVHTTDREQKRGSTVLDLIGNTPLLRLRKFEAGLNGVELYGKAEWFNPGGSVKDRPAAGMVREGLRSGRCGLERPCSMPPRAIRGLPTR